VELGAQDELVACTEYCEPGRDVPRVGWEGASAAESILRAKPTLVLRQKSRRARDPLRETLERAGVRVVAVPSETMADARAAILAVGEAVGRAQRARTFLARFDAELERARARAAGKPRRRVLLVFGRDPGGAANITAAGPGSFLDELIRYAGGENVLADVDAPYPSLSLESALRRKPDVIIDNQPGDDDVRDVWAKYRDLLPAVREGRVYAVRDAGLLIPGPHLPRAVRRMVEMIHGGS